MARDPRDFILVLGYPIFKRHIMTGAIVTVVLILLALVVFGFFYSKFYSFEEEVAPKEVPSVGPSSALPELVKSRLERTTRIERVVGKYLAATGFDTVMSFQADGNYILRESEKNFRVVGRAPGLIRQIIRMEELRLITGYDGSEFWFDSRDLPPGMLDAVAVDMSRAVTVAEWTVPRLAWAERSEEGLEAFTLEEDTMIEGRVFHQIRDDGSFGFPIVHYIDAETGFEMLRRAKFFADGRVTAIEVRYFWPQVETPPLFPAKVIVLVNDEKVAESEITDVLFNAGLTSVLFQKPPDLPDQTP